jgi:membrane dipeptidase
MPTIHPETVFDGHNDTLLSLQNSARSFFERSDIGAVDLVRAREGRLGGSFFAIYVPPEGFALPPDPELVSRAIAATFADEATMPPSPDLGYAQRTALKAAADLLRLERAADGQARLIHTAAELERCLEQGILAMLMHLEGAEAIDEDLDALEVLYRAGLRSLGPVHSRPNRFGHGVPFKFPHSPDTGPGLTEAGKRLIAACNELRIMIDLSHLNERGFWEVAASSNAPLVATHSCAHALCPSTRNLTDRQLDAIRDSDGLVGINFHVGFLRPDGRVDRDTPLDVIADHVDYLTRRIGIDRVALGSDFEYAVPPRDLSDASCLPRLMSTLRARGYDDDSLSKLGYRNWIRVLHVTWGH